MIEGLKIGVNCMYVAEYSMYITVHTCTQRGQLAHFLAELNTRWYANENHTKSF